ESGDALVLEGDFDGKTVEIADLVVAGRRVPTDLLFGPRGGLGGTIDRCGRVDVLRASDQVAGVVDLEDRDPDQLAVVDRTGGLAHHIEDEVIGGGVVSGGGADTGSLPGRVGDRQPVDDGEADFRQTDSQHDEQRHDHRRFHEGRALLGSTLEEVLQHPYPSVSKICGSRWYSTDDENSVSDAKNPVIHRWV